MQRPSYLLQSTFPFSTFIETFLFFDSSFLQVFGHLLGPRSFDNLEGFLARKQAYFPITFDGIGIILMATIAPITYLRSWAFVVSIIVVRFMVNQRPFLFEALTQVDNNTFLFQQHLKLAYDLLPPLVCACFLLFEQFIGQ
jgi:hypothetical protein